MGIEAFCPNGHRIKVKDEFAGRLGVCPTCGSRFRLPDLPVQAAAAPLPTARLLSIDPMVIRSLPMATAYGQTATATPPGAVGLPAGSMPMSGSMPMGSVPLGSVPLGSVPLGSVPLGQNPPHQIAAPDSGLPQPAVGPGPIGMGPAGFPSGVGTGPQMPMQAGGPGLQEPPLDWKPTVRGRPTYPRRQGGSGTLLAGVLLIAVAAAAALAWQILRSRGVIP